MDQKEKDEGFKKQTPDQQLDTLIRYRDLCLKDNDRFLTAEDNFISSIMHYGLEQAYVNAIANSGKV